MQASLIDQGLDLMLYGMGTVFIFLTILVFATTLMSRIVIAYSQKELGQSPPEAVQEKKLIDVPKTQVLEAIKLAISAHRRKP